MPLNAYHRHDICDGPSISSSGLRLLFGEDSSPRHFYAQWGGNPDRAPQPDARHFVLGRALHHLILGEAFFGRLFVIRPNELADEWGELKPWNGNRAACRQWLRDRAREGRGVLTLAEAVALREMARALEAHPLVRHGALNGAIERSLFWKDPETGIWLKSRPDAIPTDSGDYTDLKSTRSCAAGAISETIRKYGYNQQAALVREASKIVLGVEMSSFTLLFVEKQSPWSVRDIRLPDQDLDRGTMANRAALRIFKRCLATGEWPGPGGGHEGSETIGLSDAARERIDRRLTDEGIPQG